ncbi:MAG TPA: hypothetical protein VNJ70_07370 [Thermoanaerobaculia bacterium]|nr:hypothetical protein [Thermoanaerobaculia bacterium]
MSQPRRPRFALDQNFPAPIVAALRDYIVEADLVPIGDIHPRLPTLDDWQLLVVLSRDSPACDGLVTTDNSMLLQERELAVLIQTKLTLVVADAAGDDPIKATGLVLAYLPWIAKRKHRHQAQVWVLRTMPRAAEDPWDRLKRIAKQQGDADPKRLYSRHKIASPAQLAKDLLAMPSSPGGTRSKLGRRTRRRIRRPPG